MPNEREVLRALVEVADTFVDDYDVVDFLHGLTARCVALLDVDEAGVMLIDSSRTLRYVASSSEQMRLVELLELQHDEGPCLDAWRDGNAAISSRTDEADQRWPVFGTHARDAGLESLAGIPMRLRNDRIGALNLFSRRPGGLSEDDQHVAQAMADIATIGVLQARAIHDGQVVTAQLQTALESRIVIEQAKGIIAEYTTLSVDDAFTMLRTYARAHHDKLTETARRVVTGALPPSRARSKEVAHAWCRDHHRGVHRREGPRVRRCLPGAVHLRVRPRDEHPLLRGRSRKRHHRELSSAEPRRDRGVRREHPLRQTEECTSCTACYQPDVCPVGAIYSEEHVPDGSAHAKYNSNDPNKGHDHTFFIEQSRAVFGD